MKNLKNLIFAAISITLALVLWSCSENNIQEKSDLNDNNGPNYNPSPYPTDRFYTEDHVWVKLESENVALIGITTYPLNSIGIVSSCNDPESEGIWGKTGLPPKKIVQIIEGSLSSFNVLMPVFGDVVDKNPELAFNPSIINVDPYGPGWILRIANFNLVDVQNLMNAGEYTLYVNGL